MVCARFHRHTPCPPEAAAEMDRVWTRLCEARAEVAKLAAIAKRDHNSALRAQLQAATARALALDSELLEMELDAGIDVTVSDIDPVEALDRTQRQLARLWDEIERDEAAGRPAVEKWACYSRVESRQEGPLLRRVNAIRSEAA